MLVEHRLVIRVRAVAACDPLAPAIHDGDRLITYRDLVANVDRAAAHLRGAGVAAGDAIALLASRDRDLPVRLLAAWTMEAAVAIIDATLPASRVAECEAIVAPCWRFDAGGVVAIPTSSPRRRGYSHVLFTSGTTGTPAAVAVSADALVGPMDWYRCEFAPGPGDRVALLAGLGHDPLLRDVFAPLSSGGTLVVPPADVFTNPSGLAGFLADARITILHATPALLELILAGRSADRLDELRLVVSGGAPLSAGLVRRLREVTDAVIVNAYGATETPQIASCAVLASGAVPDPGLADDTALGVGTGVAGAELVLDGDEVVVCSPYLALGYLDDSGREDRFMADPHGRPGYRAYRTGDRGAPAAGGGGLRISGRIDRQISINGMRIAPEEIEAAARRHPAVHEAHAVAYLGPAGDLVGLTAVLKVGAKTDSASLRTFLRSYLPRQAVPTRVSIMAGFHLDRNHKVVPVPGGEG